MSTDDNTKEITTHSSEHVPLTDYTVIQETLTGTVKWFNNKAGFGFITVCEEGEYKDKDIFIHYSSIRVSNLQYKYLVQGEYVDFTLVKANSDTHEFQAMNVSGVKGGPIMCETRRTMVHTPGSGGPGYNITTVNRRNTMRDSKAYTSFPTSPPTVPFATVLRTSALGSTGPTDEVRNQRQTASALSSDDLRSNFVGSPEKAPVGPDARNVRRPGNRESNPRRQSVVGRPIIDREPRTPRAPQPKPNREPSVAMNGDDLLGFTKVTKKRSNKSNAPKPTIV
jgi:cold shock CspA family protein